MVFHLNLDHITTVANTGKVFETYIDFLKTKLNL